ncbi:mucin-2-like [Dorcoceras hygrometricum]|uniref:Mucin-2-like n=1 Tax=Dorcoceras hygrometricum TaxID=472368 RepID=A0A2Z7BNL2_9LAMI|nr:mucin-2-like [Dorcoceras hygrometricum]
MASSLISRSHHINFDSVFRLDDAEMVQMFESLITTGLKEFLGCPAIFYENALTEFFANGSVRDGLIVSTIGGIAVEISESVFAATFALPTEGLTDLSEVPRNFISDAQSLFSVSEKELGHSHVVTRDRFLLMTAITFDVKVNWGSLLFGVLKEMVTPDSRQAKGYAIQICVLLKNIPGLELGESKAFPAPRILNEKTVHRIVSVNENVGVQEVAEAPRAKKTPVKKIVSKKRPAARDAEVAPVITNKRTTKSKPVAVRRISLEKQVEDSSTSHQPVEGVATGEQIPVVGVATGEHIPVAGVATGEQIPAAEDATEDADATIKQVLNQLDSVFEKSDVAQGGLVETWFDKAFDEEFEIADRERQDTEEEIVVGFEKGTSAGDQPPASENGADGTNDDESLSIEEHQARIPFNASLPSTLAPPITQIRFGQGIEFRDVDAYTPNLQRIDISDKGKGILVEDDIQGHPSRETFSLICADIEFLIALREKVIEYVSSFVSSFSLRKLASLQSEDIFAKEGQVLSWAETDSSYVAIQRRQFIIAKYRELLLCKFIDARRKNFVSGTPTSAIDLKVLNLLSAAHLFALKYLLRNMKAHQLEWTRPSSSSFFEGPIIDRGSFIPVTHRSIFSKCWIRAKIMVDGSWLILEGVDYWRPISTPVNSSHWEALPQRPYIDDLAPLCVFVEPVQDIYSRPSLSRALRVVWAEICMEAIQFSILGCLRPEVNSFALEPVAPTDDKEELLYSVEVPHSPSPVVQVPESPNSSSDSDIHFDSAYIHRDSAANTQTSLPTASVDLSSLLDVLQASLCQRMDDANNEFLSRLHSTERSLQTSLGHQNDYLRRLIEGARQEGQTQDDIQLLRLNVLRKSVMDHDVKADTDSLDVRNKFIALDAKFRSLDGQIATIRNDQLEFQTKIAADILGLSTQISEIADYIRSGDGKKGEIGSSSRRPLPASQPSSHVQGSAVRTQTFPPTTGTFAERVEQARRHIIESGQVISKEEAVERVIEADSQESDRLERERSREMRERRLSRSGAYKMRRG